MKDNNLTTILMKPMMAIKGDDDDGNDNSGDSHISGSQQTADDKNPSVRLVTQVCSLCFVPTNSSSSLSSLNSIKSSSSVYSPSICFVLTTSSSSLSSIIFVIMSIIYAFEIMTRHHQFYMQWTRHTSLHYIKSYTMCQLFCRHQLPCVPLLKCDCHILPFNCPHLERGASLQFWDNL